MVCASKSLEGALNRRPDRDTLIETNILKGMSLIRL